MSVLASWPTVYNKISITFLVPSTDVFWLCNFPKIFFLKLARISVLFLILWRKFLTAESRLSTLPCSFYSKDMADGTLSRRHLSPFEEGVPS
jgi:hypothetical protein